MYWVAKWIIFDLFVRFITIIGESDIDMQV